MSPSLKDCSIEWIDKSHMPSDWSNFDLPQVIDRLQGPPDILQGHESLHEVFYDQIIASFIIIDAD